MTPNPNPSPELLQRAREILAQAYERADLICPAADVRSGNKIDWVREKVALDAIVATLSPQTLPAPGEVDHIAAAGNMIEVERIKRAIWGYVNAQPEEAAILPVVQFLANRDVFLAEAIALATSRSQHEGAE